MSIKVTVPNTSSDSVVFGSANTPTAAEVVGIDSGSSNGQLAFKTTASGTSTERMRIDASGNVGIGKTPSGTYKLESYSTDLFPAYFSGNNTNTTAIVVGNTGTRNWELAVGGTANGAAIGGLYLYDQTAGSARLIIDTSGRVTTPYQPAFRARQTGSANYTSGSTLSFQTVDFNIGGHYSTATNRFTAPVSGVYYFSALAFAPPNTFVFLNFRVNGTLSDRIEYYGSNATYNQHCIAVLKYLNAGDYIDMTNPSGTVHLNGGGDQGSQFNGYLIG